MHAFNLSVVAIASLASALGAARAQTPEGDVAAIVKRAGTRLMAPGVGDDSRGLALMLALLRALDAVRVQTASDILFVGSVGEEGLGDLRGVRFLFQRGRYSKRIGQFIAIDLSNESADAWPVTNTGLGVVRYRVTFTGPAGHNKERRSNACSRRA